MKRDQHQYYVRVDRATMADLGIQARCIAALFNFQSDLCPRHDILVTQDSVHTDLTACICHTIYDSSSPSC